MTEEVKKIPLIGDWVNYAKSSVIVGIKEVEDAHGGKRTVLVMSNSDEVLSCECEIMIPDNT